ncbi:MAG: YidC/Oxa1 family membrane protein insertase [Oscillospiraceae bacterium]|nr:YidC/Oxa1 family membrane protein insertase [Oscillospiraceae bacterium]
MGKIITLPFAALLRLMYSITESYGLSIILFSLVVTLVMLPFQMKSKRSMIRMGRLSGKQAELQKQYAKNQQKYQEELAKLYQEEGINPMGGCLWSFLPMFVLIPLYSIIRQPIIYFMGLSETACSLLRETAAGMGYVADTMGNGAFGAYEQVHLVDFVSQRWNDFNWQGIEGCANLFKVNYNFLGINLSGMPSAAFSNFSMEWSVIGLILIPIMATLVQLVSSFVIAKSNGQSAEQQKQMRMMNIILPLTSLWFCSSMPGGLGVYWIANSLWMMIRESILGKFYTKKLNEEEDEREAKREAARKLRMEEAKKKAAEQRELEPKKPKKQPQKSPEKKVSTNEAGRIGERPYARGRSYREDRYDEKE